MKNRFYETIADNYDYIFPPSPPQVEFISSFAKDKENILDIGCGTGNLSIGLSKHFNQVFGIDLDSEMVNLAKAKDVSNIDYKCMNMLTLEKHFKPSQFNNIASCGNTLVHLSSLAEIEDFFTQTRSILKPHGTLFIQIINYDRILDNNIEGLPTVDNDHIKFERYYKYQKQEHKISFDTILTIKKSGTIINNSVQLLPIRKKEIHTALVNAGYKNISFYGNFKKEELKETSIPMIIKAF